MTRKIGAGLAAVWVLTGGLTVTAWGQASDAALRDRVAQLVEKLGSDTAAQRDAAQEALIKLGPKALTALPDEAKIQGQERKDRLAKVRAALLEANDRSALTAAKVTIQGQGIRLSEALRQLQSQSGNGLTDLREQMGADVTNPALDLDIQDKPFLEALDILTKKAELSTTYFTGDGTIGLMAEAPPAQPLLAYAGPFRVSFKQFTTVRNLQADTSASNAQFEIAWEPRLRPMLLKLKMDEIEVLDDQGKKVAPRVMEESEDVVLRPENPAAEVNLNMESPERSAKKLASLKVKGEVTVPAGLKTFTFADLSKGNNVQSAGDIKVTLESTEIDEQVWKVNVEIAYPQGGEAFESYRQGLFNNRIWLRKADGSRFEHNGGFSNTSSAEGVLGFEYLFVDAPGKPSDYALVYETPSKILTIPLEFEFKDVPLP